MGKRGPRAVPVEERFWRHVRRASGDECWLWTGALNRRGVGYGVLGLSCSPRRNVYAHRLSYELVSGQIPDGLEIDHLCRVPQCVNPSHLEAVTKRVNCLRSESPFARHARKTHCPQGHEYNEANTRRSARNERSCRACARDYQRALRAKRRMA